MKLADKIEHISESDVLNAGREKINKFAIDPALRAEENSVNAQNIANDANKIVNETKDRLNNIVSSKTEGAEVIDARGRYTLLSDRFNAIDDIYTNEINSYFGDRKYLVSSFNTRDWLKMSLGILDVDKNYVSILDAGGIDVDPIFGVREPSMYYLNGYFYIVYTLGQKQKETGINTDGFNWDYIPCKKTKDFINFETYNITSPAGFWAPQFFEIKNQLYIGLSGSDGDYYTTINIQTREIGEIKKVKINVSDITLMDSYFYEDKGTIYLATKVEKSTNKNYKYGDILVFSSDEIGNSFSFLSKIPFRYSAEGPVIIKENNIFYVYADVFLNKYSASMQSTDLLTWTKETIVEVTDGTRIQHFDVLDISEIKNVIFALKNKFIENDYKKIHPPYVVLNDYVENGVLKRPTKNNKVIYNIHANQHIDLKSIIRQSAIDTEEIYIFFNTNNNEDATLTIYPNADDNVIPRNGITTPNNQPITFRASIDSGKTIKLKKIGGDYFPGGWDNSSNWRIEYCPADGVLYELSGYYTTKGNGEIQGKYVEYRNFIEVEIFGYFTGLEGANLGVLSNQLPDKLKPNREFAIPLFTDVYNDDGNKTLLMGWDGIMYNWGATNALVKDRKYSFNINFKAYR